MKSAKLFLFLFSILTFRASAQTVFSAQTLQGVWLIDSGAFPGNIVKLKAYEASKDSLRNYSGYELVSSGDVKIVQHSVGNLKFCGNGSPYIKTGKWTYKKKHLRLIISGGYFAAGTYSYNISYKITSFENGLLILRKARTYKNKRCESCPN